MPSEAQSQGRAGVTQGPQESRPLSRKAVSTDTGPVQGWTPYPFPQTAPTVEGSEHIPPRAPPP